jgi:DNA-binding FadR family transcriptional regulator
MTNSSRPARAPEKLAARLIDGIEKELLGASWPTGAFLGTEPDLLNRYGVSRAVFREAVRIGEHRGVLVMRRGPRGGLVVGQPSSERVTASAIVFSLFQHVTVAELIEVAELLAPTVAGLAAERATLEDVNALRQQLTSDGRDFPSIVRGFIAKASHNPAAELFTEAFGRLLSPTVLNAIGDPESLALNEQSCSEVVEAIADHSPALAANSISEHIGGLRQLVGDRLTQQVVSLGVANSMMFSGGHKLAEQVAAEIISDVVNRGWPEGEVLGSEPALMAKYGVSRAAFREAIRLIEDHQVCRMRRGPGGGLFITRPTAEPVVSACATYLEFRSITSPQLFELRLPLEAFAIRQVAQSVTPEIVARLSAIVEAEIAAQFQMPIEDTLHVAIAELTGNRVLTLVVRILAELTERHLPAPDTADEHLATLGDESERSHRAVLAAIAAGDGEAAAAVMTGHLTGLSPYLR